MCGLRLSLDLSFASLTINSRSLGPILPRQVQLLRPLFTGNFFYNFLFLAFLTQFDIKLLKPYLASTPPGFARQARSHSVT